MADDGTEPVLGALRAALTAAMKARDRAAVSTYRIAMAAIDNAQAVPLHQDDRAGSIEASAVGPGVTDVARRPLTSDEMADIVRRDAADRRRAATLLGVADPERAAELERAAGLLDRVVEGTQGRTDPSADHRRSD